MLNDLRRYSVKVWPDCEEGDKVAMIKYPEKNVKEKYAKEMPPYVPEHIVSNNELKGLSDNPSAW